MCRCSSIVSTDAIEERVHANINDKITQLRDKDPEYAIYFAKDGERGHEQGAAIAEAVRNYVLLSKKGDI